MQLPNDIKTTFQQLCENQQFLSNIAYYTKVGYDFLVTPNTTQQSSTQCPTPFLLALTYYISTGQSLQSLSIYIPQSVREQYTKAIRVLQKKSTQQQNITLTLLNDHIGNLRDVKWQMSIEDGREVWIVELIVGDRQQAIIMKLNYQELSLFSFKINQILGHIKSVDMDKVM